MHGYDLDVTSQLSSILFSETGSLPGLVVLDYLPSLCLVGTGVANVYHCAWLFKKRGFWGVKLRFSMLA